jgi:hypothetical protein
MTENKKGTAATKGADSPVTLTKTAEEWGRELRVRPHIVAGVKVFAGWRDKQISKAEFERKCKEWLNRTTKTRK